jgi:23S rRNA (guanosine2251-2'-O)-methyltransferase
MNRKLSMDELGRISADEFHGMKKIPIVLILENIRSASNVGSVFRSSDSFAIDKIYLCGYTATPPHREILKTALGATESVTWEYVGSSLEVIDLLRKDGFTITSVEQTEKSIPLGSFRPQADQKLALILGNEVDGVSAESIAKSDFCLEIEQFGTKHSLNVSVCAGIVLFYLGLFFHREETS